MFDEFPKSIDKPGNLMLYFKLCQIFLFYPKIKIFLTSDSDIFYFLLLYKASKLLFELKTTYFIVRFSV
jgi:hypothetical protein